MQVEGGESCRQWGAWVRQAGSMHGRQKLVVCRCVFLPKNESLSVSGKREGGWEKKEKESAGGRRQCQGGREGGMESSLLLCLPVFSAIPSFLP